MKNTRKQQKTFILILSLLVCLAAFAICSLLDLEFSSFNKAYAQEHNVDDVRNILSDASDSTYPESSYLELYNEDGTMQMIQEQVSAQINNQDLVNPLATTPSFNERKLIDSGKPDSESIVITIMGDGFTASQQADFINAATDAIDKMVGNPTRGIAGCSPFNLFRDYFTVYAIEVISNQSGVSRDAAINNGVIVDNYFGSSYYDGNNTSNIERALVITKKSRAKALKKPNSAMTAIICNSTRWGGTGGEFAVLSRAGGFERIMLHEFGHSFGELADEYYYPSDGAFSGSEKPNRTKNSNANTIKWKDLIGTSGVGIYPYSTGVDRTDPNFDSKSDSWFKPHLNCKMQDSTNDFCPVCANELISKLSNISKYIPNAPTYTENGISVAITNKNGGTWTLRVTNDTKKSQAFLYNTKMCFKNDAKEWSGLKNINQTKILASGESISLDIQENGTATSIAISYVSGSRRYIFYADNLKFAGTLTSYSSTAPTYSYTQHGMRAGIIGKNGSTWQIKLTNNTGSERSFWYNRRMCNFGDAQNWTTLSDIEQTQKLAAGESTIIEIQEYGTATSIALSYINGSTRYIFYANNLNAAGTMSSYSNTKAYNSYTKNGMTVSIAGNKNGTWLIELTNNTGSGRTFEYNYKMCYAGDAEKWTGLSHPASVYLADGETTSKPLQISENGAATSIAISYMDGNIRKIFYAKNLNVAGTMTAYESTVDPSASSGGECVAAGTLITLADGSQKAVEELTGNELLLVWNLQTGSLDYAPILFIDSEQIGHYEVIKLSFSDGTAVDVISEHGFWDTDLNEYVYLDKYAADYIGHSFLKQDGSGMTEVVLTGVEISTEVTTAYSPVTYGHLCYFVNGMLSMPGGIEGLFNIFEVDGETMAYDAEAMAADIEQYGLFTYEEFNELVPVTEEMFESVNGQYLKVAIGKGLISLEQISGLVERYSQFF